MRKTPSDTLLLILALATIVCAAVFGATTNTNQSDSAKWTGPINLISTNASWLIAGTNMEVFSDMVAGRLHIRNMTPTVTDHWHGLDLSSPTNVEILSEWEPVLKGTNSEGKWVIQFK